MGGGILNLGAMYAIPDWSREVYGFHGRSVNAQIQGRYMGTAASELSFEDHDGEG